MTRSPNRQKFGTRGHSPEPALNEPDRPPQPHTIRLNADGKYVENLFVDETFDGDRDDFNNLKYEGGVSFRTKAGKCWFMKFSEFSFVARGIAA